ncbi:centrosome-associated zinc finger protein Cp190 [Onthophagus taurus]|uniref:centrosome-associated zinc finger protein Cp190 n=1 Tax=Onthophagus taurus TaxID=166361 RepID=UPI0039BE7EDC
MGDSNKQVRVDNWGVFFLQRLQVFFNKTDYCDLTLQFEGNVQLKVHRLVMSACTEYFNILEHTCEMIDGNTIVMPDDLQADVILPIVNFMYTGMLEFPMPIFDKLYRTAELMNIPILIKLLDAQRKPIKNSLRRQQQTAWQNLKKIKPDPETPARKLPVWKRKHNKPPSRTSSPQLFSTETTTSSTLSQKRNSAADPLALYDNAPKPTRFEWPEDDLNNTFNLIDSSFDDISYTSKPLLTQDDELRASTSFDAVKFSANVNPPKKNKDYPSNIDLNDVREYVKEQKIRTEMEFEEEDEDDPDNYLVESHNKRKLGKEGSPMHSKKVRFTVSEKENKETTISVTPKTAGEMDHTKIISEVLKRYPHLVKKNKNIKLKIMAKSPTKETTKTPSIIKAPTTTTTKIKLVEAKAQIKAVTTKIVKPQPDEGPWVCKKCSFNSTEPVEFVLYYLYRKHMTDVHHEKFDAKMCKHCGHQSSKHNLLMYHQYTKHGVKPPPAYNFPKCPRCPFIALTENLLQKHLESAHSKYDSQCVECKVAFNSQSSLLAHIQITGHSNPNRCNFDCQYCTKRFNSVTDLFSHIRSAHRDEARRDGMVSIDETDMDEEEEEEEEVEDEEYVPEVPRKKKKVELVGNVKENKHNEIINEIENSQGIVDIVVLDDNQQYILHNEQQLTEESLVNHPEYIIPELTNEYNDQPATQEFNDPRTTQANVITQSMLNIANNSEIASTDELVMVLTDHDYNDANNGILTNENSNIVVLYSHPVDGQQSEFITSEGKLILNPQTGLLELRNDNVDNNSQDAQIESIELIQREINNGLIQQADVEDDKSGVLDQKETIEMVQNNIKCENETVINEGNVPVEIENNREEEIVSEIQEESENIETNIQRNEEEENLGFTNQFELSENQRIDPDVNFVLTDESQEIIPEETNQEIVENESVIEKNVSEESPPIINFDLNMEEQPTQEKEAENIENQEIFQVEKIQNQEEYLEPPNETPNDNTQINSNENNVKTEIETPQLDIENVADEIQPDQEINELEKDHVETPNNEPEINNTQEEEIITNLPEVINEEEKINKENVENEPIITPEPNLNENESIEKNSEIENNEIISSPPTENKENTEIIPDSQPKEPTINESEELINKDPIDTEPTDILEETTPVLEESAIPLPNMEEVESVEEITEMVQVENLPEDTQAYDDVNVLLQETMDMETVDENSQQSQDSQNSTSQSSKEIVVAGSGNVGAGGVPNEATKISILNDWEDTEDSQQSDYPGKTGMENAVNKIINDWDDDDDEAQVMNT